MLVFAFIADRPECTCTSLFLLHTSLMKAYWDANRGPNSTIAPTALEGLLLHISNNAFAVFLGEGKDRKLELPLRRDKSTQQVRFFTMALAVHALISFIFPRSFSCRTPMSSSCSCSRS